MAGGYPLTISAKAVTLMCCRQMEGYEPYPEDPWATCEFHVKWKRWSYIHCSWDTRDTLSQLGGYKRVLNYMKRTDEQKARLLPHALPCTRPCPAAPVKPVAACCAAKK